MIEFLLSRTALDSLYLPAAICAAFIAFAPTREKPHPTGLAISLAFLMGLLMVRPLPVWPPVGGIGYLPFLGLLGLGFGLAADRPRYRLFACALFVLCLPALATILVGSQEYGGRLRGTIWLIYPLLIIAGMIVFGRLIGTGSRPAAGRALFFASLALGVVAWLYGSRISLHALGLAAVILSALLVLPRLGLKWPLSASFAAGSFYFTIAATLILSRDLLALPVAISFFAFFIPGMGPFLGMKHKNHRSMLELAAGSLIVLAAGLSYLYAP
ncbi:hypothetical protein JCM17845_05550 [Iodidimonas gelatinilytica]|uniref:Uncharacterized protein n=1 Tax=Iodidimonas gelatinilytica TaxID=1236966 RepID=A0A5A7MVI9_9PROT|nr:hypothetical protein [Iodidimonas gelatinilytica]GEQ99931.1 hypothetical protein JCM17845_05550 [Iodidimonas gelatinilytica]